MPMQFEPIEATKRYKSRRQALLNERASFDPIWRDIRDFFGPRTARFQGEQVNRGDRQDDKIINSAPRYAVRTLAGGMQSGITSPLRPWFKLQSPDPELNEFDPVKFWLSDVERRMREVFAKSNFYNVLKTAYGTLGLYGTAAVAFERDDEDIIRLHHYPIGSYSIATDYTGRVNTVFRDFRRTAEQMEQAYGDKVSDQVKVAMRNGNYDAWFDVCQVIEPNRYARPGSMLAKDKRFMSMHLDPTAGIGQDGILRQSGFDQMRILVPRWDILGEDVYGTGCGEIALGDGKQMQLMEKRKLQGIDQNVRPAMLADASMRNQRSSINPGETTYVNGLITGNPGFRPAYQVNPYLNELREEIMRVENRVDEAFFKNLFLMVSEFADQPNITATQINTLREEKLMMLGPVLERLNDELLDPAIDITFSEMVEREMIPPAPEELQGMPLRVEYISVLAQAQKALGIGNIERFVGFVGNLAAVDPSVMDKVDLDQAVDEYADGVGVAPRIVRSDEKVAQIRQGRQQQQAAMQAAEMAPQVTQAAKNLSDTSLDSNNMLTALAGAGVSV